MRNFLFASAAALSLILSVPAFAASGDFVGNNQLAAGGDYLGGNQVASAGDYLGGSQLAAGGDFLGGNQNQTA